MLSSRNLAAAAALAALSSVLVPSSPVRAALDPEVNKPYQLHVVLSIAENRQLTKLFKEQVERELRDSLRAAYGDLCEVEVVREHPRLKEVLAQGLQVLDGWKDVSDVKTHFVLIDFVDGQYEIQARQHDGLTGQASPVVRRDRTPHRDFVARTAALMLGPDFGLVGTVTDKVDGDTVKVTLKGSGLGAPLDRLVQKDDVFTIVEVGAGSGGLRTARVQWALLQVQKEPENGVCVCRLFRRYKNPFDGAGAGVLGHRCLKIATTQAPLRLRLVRANAKTLTPEPNRAVQVRRFGFSGEEDTKLGGATDSSGFYSTEAKDKGAFNHVAFVSVLEGTAVKAQVPVAIVDERVVVVPVIIGGDAAVQLTLRKELWVQQVYESLLVLADLFKELEGLVGKPEKRQETLDKARAGVKGVQEDVVRFQQQQVALVQEAGGAGKIDLAEGVQRLHELQAGQKKLEGFLTRMEKVIAEENDPKRKELQAKVSQAQLLEGEAEFGKALALYDEVLAAGLDDPDLKKYADKLREAWKLKGDRHKQARAFIEETWPGVDPLRMKDRLAEARQAFEACRTAGDSLTPQKLIKVAVVHAAKLKERLGTLNPDVNEDDRAVARVIADTATDLNKLVKDVNAFLEKAAPVK